MIPATSGFNTANGKLVKSPIFMIQISGVATAYTTMDLSWAGITGTLPAYEPWLITPTGSSQSVDVQGGTSSIGEIQCEVVDYGGAVLALVGAGVLEGSLMTLSVGYPGTAITDFATLCVHRIYKVIPGTGYGSFLFCARDIQMDAKLTVWNHPLNGYPLTASNPWIVQGAPPEIMMAMWLLGLGGDISTLDVAFLNQLLDPHEGMYSSARPFLFELDQPFTAKDFLENQLYKASGAYPVVTNTGKMSMRGYRPFARGVSPVFAFTQDNISVLPSFDRAPILNDLLWSFDVTSEGGSDYATTQLFLEATSISQFGRSNERQVQSSGLRTELGAWWFAQDISDRMFSRFAGTTGLRGAAPIVSVESFLMTLPVWLGDYVSLTHPLMPDMLAGTMGVTGRIFEVIDREPDYANGKMKFQLLDTGLTGAPAAVQWPAAVIDTAVIF